MAGGTDRDKPPMPFNDSVLRRWLVRQGFRNAVLDPALDLPGLVPSANGVTSTWVMTPNGWAAPSGGGSWGSITGTLSDQTDLQAALDAKVNIETGAFTTNAPTSAVAASASTELVRKGEMDTGLAAKQDADSDLDALALITIDADQSIHGTSTGVWTKYTLTSFGRSLVDDDSAATARTTLGLGDLAVEDTVAHDKLVERVPYVAASEAGDPVRTVGASTTAFFTITDLTVPGSTSTDWSAELVIEGVIFNNSGATNPLRIKTTYGTTAMTNSKDFSRPGNDADDQAFKMTLTLNARGATNKQQGSIEYWLASASTSTAGIGQYYGNQVEGFARGTAAETSTGALNLKVEGQFDTSSASTHIEVYSTRLTYYPGS